MLLFPNRPYWNDKGEFVKAPDGPPICTCPPSVPENLCDQCLALNLRHVIFCSPERRLIDLGRLDAMLARPECNLCSLIVLGCKQVWRGEWTGVTETKCSLNDVDITRQLKNGYAMQVTATHKDRPFQWIEFEIVIRSDGKGFAVERRLDSYPEVCLERMRSFLAECEENHAECRMTSKTPGGMRIIDVQKLNVVDAPLHCRYCALSYVWGKPSTPWLTLTRDNTDDLKVENSLVGRNLPRTIMDAICACKGLGERYLWVDSLCIVQDDAVIQKGQIDIMDMIYASAAVTIVAAAGDDTNAGLPGVTVLREETTRQTTTIQDMEVSNALPRLKDMIDISTWNTRGWTYQERVLSHRCIFFTASQTYYSCSQGVQNEEPDRLPPTIWTTGRARKNIQTVSFMDLYTDRVAAYTRRSLTSQTDILRAFQGILNDMSRNYAEIFHYGLPESQFEQGLVWQKSRQSIGDEAIEIAPSWSWASARSAIKYTIPEIGIHLSQTPLPAFWQNDEEPSQFIIPWLLNIDGVLKSLKTNTSKGDRQPFSFSSSLDGAPDELQALTLLKPGRLLFSTQRVCMNLQNGVPYNTQDTWWTDYVSDVEFSQISIASILLPNRGHEGSSSEELAGFIEVEKSWAETALSHDNNKNERRKEWEFLAVSLTTSKSNDYMHYHLTKLRNVNFPLVWSRNVRELVVHVLLVESTGDGLRRRLGVGKVFLDMWERAKPETQWAVLE